MDAEEMKKNKAKKLRYKKPIVKNLNLETIQQDLWDIQESCEEVHWFTDSDDGSETLINALSGDEDEAYEFKMAFADLCAECERMFDDMQEEWVPDCFDILFVAAGAGEQAAHVGDRLRLGQVRLGQDLRPVDRRRHHLRLRHGQVRAHQASPEDPGLQAHHLLRAAHHVPFLHQGRPLQI